MTGFFDGIEQTLQALTRAQLTRRSHWYVHWLPVDQSYAAHGSDIWGLQTAVCDIAIEDGRFALADRRGPILELRHDLITTRRAESRLESVMHTWLDGQPQSCRVRVNSLEEGMRIGGSRLTLHDAHPRARELAEVLLSRRALATSVMPRSQSILFAPDRLTPAVLRRLGPADGVDARAMAEAGA